MSEEEIERLRLYSIDLRKIEAKLQKEIERRESAEKALRFFDKVPHDSLDIKEYFSEWCEVAREHFKKYQEVHPKIKERQGTSLTRYFVSFISGN